MNKLIKSNTNPVAKLWMMAAAVLVSLVVMGGCAHDRDDHHRDHDHDHDWDHNHHDHDRDHDHH